MCHAVSEITFLLSLSVSENAAAAVVVTDLQSEKYQMLSEAVSCSATHYRQKRIHVKFPIVEMREVNNFLSASLEN